MCPRTISFCIIWEGALNGWSLFLLVFKYIRGIRARSIQVYTVILNTVAKNQNKVLKLWRTESTKFIGNESWGTFLSIRHEISTLRDDENLTGRVSLLRFKQVCSFSSTWLTWILLVWIQLHHKVNCETFWPSLKGVHTFLLSWAQRSRNILRKLALLGQVLECNIVKSRLLMV